VPRRRGLRPAFTILSALSLLLCVAVCVWWVRYVNLAPSSKAPESGIWIYCRSGHITFATVKRHPTRVGSWTFPVHVRVPCWLVAGTLAVPPAVHTMFIIRLHRRRRPGHCICCGYDLRASPERCPECGTPVQKAM
jgi:hypothetical protein